MAECWQLDHQGQHEPAQEIVLDYISLSVDHLGFSIGWLRDEEMMDVSIDSASKSDKLLLKAAKMKSRI